MSNRKSILWKKINRLADEVGHDLTVFWHTSSIQDLQDELERLEEIRDREEELFFPPENPLEDMKKDELLPLVDYDDIKEEKQTSFNYEFIPTEQFNELAFRVSALEFGRGDPLFEFYKSEFTRIKDLFSRYLRWAEVNLGDYKIQFLVSSDNFRAAAIFGVIPSVFSSKFQSSVNISFNDFLSKLARYLREYQHILKIDLYGIRLINVRLLGGDSAHRTIKIANKKWLEISPVSRINCFYQSVAICIGWKKNNELLKNKELQINRGKDLKRFSKIKSKNIPDEEDLQIVSDYKRCKINI